jgi:hypothetical protein
MVVKSDYRQDEGQHARPVANSYRERRVVVP